MGKTVSQIGGKGKDPMKTSGIILKGSYYPPSVEQEREGTIRETPIMEIDV